MCPIQSPFVEHFLFSFHDGPHRVLNFRVPFESFFDFPCVVLAILCDILHQPLETPEVARVTSLITSVFDGAAL